METFPKLALGTWLMGGAKEPDPNNDDKKDIATIKLALENGVRLIDTAQNYANGRSEELIGEALLDRPRKSYQLLTKQNKERLSYDNVLEDFEESLKRLKVEYVDYFVCHAPNIEFDIEDFFRATNKLHADGKIKNVGVSNFGPEMLKIAVKSSDTPITVNQVHMSLDDDDVFSTGTYDFCIENGISLQAYRTLVDLEENEVACELLQQIAQRRKITSQQVALSYLNSYMGVTFTIRASSTKHWVEIKDALEIKLDDSEIEELRRSHEGIKGKFRGFLLQ